MKCRLKTRIPLLGGSHRYVQLVRKQPQNQGTPTHLVAKSDLMGVCNFLGGVVLATITSLLSWWLMHRVARTEEALKELLLSDEITALLTTDAPEDGSDCEWNQYQSETVRPGLDKLELFAALANTRIIQCLPWDWLRMYNMTVVRRTAGKALISLWKSDDCQRYINHHRNQQENGGETIYKEFEDLAKWLAAQDS